VENLEDKIIIAVAPVAHLNSPVPEGCRNPLSPDEIAAETLACVRAGAAIAHHHIRNPQGQIVSDLSWYRETVGLILGQTDVILNVSTGGVSDLSLEERCVGLDVPEVEMGSLNMGSTNFGEGAYINTLPDIRFWATRMKERGVVPELETFSGSMVETGLKLRTEGILEDPLHFNLCLGFENALSATAGNLWRLVQMLPKEARWGFVHERMEDFSLIAGALGMGATVLRVGYEDGGHLRKGEVATSNAALVERLATLIQTAGKTVASVDEARLILGLPGR
jgi:3-keto-5-aminohexanoate cleavage enzyme